MLTVTMFNAGPNLVDILVEGNPLWVEVRNMAQQIPGSQRIDSTKINRRYIPVRWRIDSRQVDGYIMRIKHLFISNSIEISELVLKEGSYETYGAKEKILQEEEISDKEVSSESS